MSNPPSLMTRHFFPRRLLLAGLLTLAWSTATAQEPARWFQIEVSVFSNELESDRNEELLSPERTTLQYPARLRRLQTLFDLLMIPALITDAESNSVEGLSTIDESIALDPPQPSAQEIRQQIIAATGPFPPVGGDTYRFPDFERDPFLQLPDSESEFQQTNRALERSAEHRLLFHGLWRQPMPDPGRETPVVIEGGQLFGAHHELEGSLSLHFNSGRDRVVIDADLWLAEFSRLPQDSQWQLPDVPLSESALPAREQDEEQYSVRRVYHMQQSRDMRSTEFHYLDHPAIGIVVTVFPYEVPPLGEQETESDF